MNHRPGAPSVAGGATVSVAARVARGLGLCALAGLLVAGLLTPAVAGAATLVVRAGAVPASEPPLIADGPHAATVVTDVDGAPIAWLYDRYRRPVPASAIASTMTSAIVSIEDRRFFAHGGVDYQGLGRALVANGATGSPLEGQGASTLTMQYVKNYRLYVLARTSAQRSAATADTVGRKLVEVQLANRLEQRLSKQQILTRYLDLVYFGHGAYGVEAAARVYFGVDAGHLNVPQSALLAGLVRSPEGYDPVSHPDAARARRSEVLRAMVDTRAITPDAGETADAAPLGVADDPQPPAEGCTAARPGTGYFCRYVVDTLAARGVDLDRLRVGGYTVRTTLDPRVTASARRAVLDQVPASSDVTDVTAVVGPGTDRRPVLALAANRTYGNDASAGESAFELPTEPLRGAGSTYKIFTAAAALEQGIVTPSSTLDVPGSYTSQLSGQADYTVDNFGSYDDEMSLQRALALSPNTAFVKLEDRVGSLRPIVDVARALGLRRTLDAPAPGGGTVADAVVAQRQASFTLGPLPTSPLELANVGATIRSDGMWCPPDPLAAVTDRDGVPVDVAAAPCSRAVPSSVAQQLVEGLSKDDVYGTSSDAAADAGWDRSMTGKTGTTQEQASSAFLGATDRYAGAVMTFADRGAPRPVCLDPVETCDDGELTGGSVPAATWYRMVGPLYGNTATSSSASSEQGDDG